MKNDNDDSVTFVTGYPEHLLARKVLRQLLLDEQQRVACLVEERFLEQAKSDLSKIGTGADRVEIILGDPVAMDFSLSGAAYLSLARRTRVLHHCANCSYLGASRRDAKLGTLTAAREMLEFAEAAPQLMRCVYWSTALVSGQRLGVIREDELEDDAGFRNPIEEMHFRAERLMHNAMHELPIVVLRPTILTCDSTTGEMDLNQGFLLLVRLLLNAPAEFRIPLPALGDTTLDLVPVDYAAKAGCFIAKQDMAIGKAFHLCDPNALPATEVFALLSEATGHRIATESFAGDLLGALLKFPGMQRLAPVPRSFLQQALTEVKYDSRRADSLLEASGMHCPSFRDYVMQLVDFVKQHRNSEKVASN
ncbi:MAG: SDR family oxidoreductase [Myxococcales bacterium]|nr:MAG: SDR family oxidoreductase [Myxococcales bacterium]